MKMQFYDILFALYLQMQITIFAAKFDCSFVFVDPSDIFRLAQIVDVMWPLIVSI